MNGDEIIFACRQCGKHIRRSAEKVGTLVACSACGRTNVTPCFAGQVSVPPWALAAMKRANARQGRALLVGAAWLVTLVVLVALTALLDSSVVWAWGPVGIGFFIVLFMLSATTAGIFPYLSRPPKEAEMMAKYAFPLLFIFAIASYFSLRRHIRRLDVVELTPSRAQHNCPSLSASKGKGPPAAGKR